MTPYLHPFDLEDRWLVTWHRDDYAIGWTLIEDGTVEITAEPGANGEADFLEDLRLVGLGTVAPTAEFGAMECAPYSGGNECIAQQLMSSVRSKMYEIFQVQQDGQGPGGPGADGPGPWTIPISFFFEGEEGAPDAADFQYQDLDGSETVKAFSMIGLGGGDLSETWIGMSESVDLGNRGNENNAQLGYGMFTTSLVRYVFEAMDSDPGLKVLATVALSGIVPALGGVPLGELPDDHLVADLAIPAEDLPEGCGLRRIQYETAMEILAAGLAALAVHEIGHSLGLDAKGAPPHGLFGGEAKAAFCVNAAGCVGAHLDTEGPNVMAAGPGSGNAKFPTDFLTKTAFFTPLEMAYFRGVIVVVP